jgi:choline kinase
VNLSNSNHELITTALLLAAGTGSRLYPLTRNMPKCLTMINDTSILERLVICLNQQGFKRLVVVTGYLENCIREFLKTRAGGMTIDYIFSPLYKTTNNIYSLWMARKIIKEPFLLVESDLVFDKSLLDDMLYPDRIAIASMQAWMNGSTVTVNHSQQVKRFQIGITRTLYEIRYKTVNIYSFSLSSWHAIVERLDRYISEGRVNYYYETVFAEMVADGNLCLQTVSFDAKPWYEIDTIADLAEAERLFPADEHETIIPYLETVTRSFSGLRASLKSNSLFMKPIHDPNIKENKVSPKEKSKRSVHGAL